MKLAKIFGLTITYTMLVIAAAMALIPIVWLTTATLRPSDQIFAETFTASHPTTQNYVDLFTTENVFFARYMANSLFLACASVILQLFFCSLAGFALAKYDFKGKKALMWVMMTTLVIPGAVTLGPGYQLAYQLGLVDTYHGMLIGAAGNVFGIFMFRQAILGVSDELLHAARIDGCSEFGIYRHVVLPVVRPMTGAFCLLNFMGNWNSLLWPSMMLQSASRHTLPIAMANLNGLYSQKYGMLMAGTFLSVLPVIILFLLLQKEFISGLQSGAVKG
jgi:multiple sugar transport system permease protein